MDIFVPGETLIFKDADIEDAPVQVDTPELPTLTLTSTPSPIPTHTSPPTITPSQTIHPSQTLEATMTIRPTASPPKIPPPTDPNLLTAMIVVGVFSVMIVFIGVWINRHQIR
jgi:hypothetical protein